GPTGQDRVVGSAGFEGWRGCVGRLRRFFFQAEDGIRDRTVTGVQTCALPISRSRQAGFLRAAFPGEKSNVDTEAVRDRLLKRREIGRASCRERVERSEGGGAVEEKEDRRGGARAYIDPERLDVADVGVASVLG